MGENYVTVKRGREPYKRKKKRVVPKESSVRVIPNSDEFRKGWERIWGR
jgi:hypothetical protein